MRELANLKKNIPALDSREVAEMMGINHWEVLRKLEGGKDRKGYIKILTDNQMVASDFFIESSYKDDSGKENRCYLLTKKGCEFLANKFTGEKGILFTAKYVERFNQMENQLKDSFMIENPIERARRWIEEQEEKLELKETIKLQAPKAESYDHYISSEGLMSVSQASKSLHLDGCGPKKIFKVLVKLGIFFIEKGAYFPKQPLIDRGYFEVKQGSYPKYKGEEREERVPYSKICVTPKGLDWLSKHLMEKGYKKL